MADHLPILKAIHQRRFTLPMRRALLLVLEGVSYRAAARAEGVYFKTLFLNAQSIPGLCEAHRGAAHQAAA